MRKDKIRRIAAALFLLFLTGCQQRQEPLVESVIQPETTIYTTTLNPEEITYPEPISDAVHGKIRNPEFDERITPEVQEVILEYLDAWYSSQASIEKQDFSSVFDLDTVHGREGYALNELIVDFMLDMRRDSPVDLTFDQYEYEVSLWRLFQPEEDDGMLYVAVIENSAIRFHFQEDVESTMITYHSFQMAPTKDGWKIRRHVDRQDVMYAINQVYEGIKEEAEISDVTDAWIQDTVEEIKNQLYREVKEGQEIGASSMENGEDELEAQHTYDRNAAVRYAQTWAGGDSLLRNEEWPDYDMYGGDCNNFISQCLFAGGIPMDFYGAQWKWYSDTMTGPGIAAGRSASWGGVDEFYTYCNTNDGFGLVSLPDADLSTGEPGDILQFYALDKWRHSVMITDVIRDKEGVPVDYFISSHSADRRNYPASAYLFPSKRLIRILGWMGN